MYIHLYIKLDHKNIMLSLGSDYIKGRVEVG